MEFAAERMKVTDSFVRQDVFVTITTRKAMASKHMVRKNTAGSIERQFKYPPLSLQNRFCRTE